MTGGASLGLRSSSYGSLQQPLHNQHQQPTAAAPRVKPPKISLGGPSREKDRVLHRICKLAGRRGVGMLLLAVVSVGVFITILSASSKDEISGGSGVNWSSSSYRFHGIPLSPPVATKPVDTAPGNLTRQVKTSVKEEMVQTLVADKPQDFPVFNISMFPKVHPCQNFSRLLPPYDKKRTGPRPCDVCYLPVEHAVALMPPSQSESPVLKKLAYFSADNSYANESNGGSIFGGHPSLQQRNESFDIQESMKIHCGFFQGSAPGIGSGFDIDVMDLHDMQRCRGVVVASAIFGNYDIIQQPKNISELARKFACFYMFVDKETESYLRNHSILGSTKKVGLWTVVVVHNLPFVDPRRTGKVPKLLLHRLFPNARYSLWIDGKLELVADPYQILERFLWRKNATFAISRHYRRFDVFVEAEANKVAGKYANASIDKQVEFYKNEGLTHYSEAKLPITSDVPEGCVIIREHIPITNLFTCLWFNEVDRFTSRDQLSFSTVRDKITSKVNWGIEMFLDCERRNFVVQAYHRDLLEQMKRSSPPPPPPGSPPPVPILQSPKIASPNIASKKDARTPKKVPITRGRYRKSRPRRMGPKSRGKDNNSI